MRAAACSRHAGRLVAVRGVGSTRMQNVCITRKPRIWLVGTKSARANTVVLRSETNPIRPHLIYG